MESIKTYHKNLTWGLDYHNIEYIIYGDPKLLMEFSQWLDERQIPHRIEGKGPEILHIYVKTSDLSFEHPLKVLEDRIEDEMDNEEYFRKVHHDCHEKKEVKK